MKSSNNTESTESRFLSVLEDFVNKDKSEVARCLRGIFELNMEGSSFSVQISEYLGRSLSDDEVFKVRYLERISKFHTDHSCDA